MARESEFYRTGETFEDRPKPGLGLLAILTLGVLIPLCVLGYNIFGNSTPPPGAEGLTNSFYWAMAVPVIFGYLIFVFLLFNTSYRVDTKKIKASNGLFSGTVQLSEIRFIHLTDFISQPIGRGKNTRSQDRGYCNRITKGVAIRTTGGMVYLSPSDPAKFAAMLHDLAPATRQGQENDSGA